MRVVPGLIAILFCSVGLFVFQNCGKAAHDELHADLSSTSVTKPNTMRLVDAAGNNTPFRVTADGTEFPAGTQFYWNAAYADSTYCGQTVYADGLTAIFTCTEDGPIKVTLTGTEPDGTLNEFSLPLVVGANGSVPPPGPPPPPFPDPSPAPGPLPGPAPLDGAALYTTNCSACHGPLASSTRHGRTRAQLDTALATVGAMAGLQGLTSAERDAIIQALQ